MQQRPENFNAAGEDPEATLVAPRFDAEDARHAHPVVPLVEARTPYVGASRRRGRRRTWLHALLAVALLAVAALGGALATKVMQSPRTDQAQEQTSNAPAQTAEAPPPAQASTPAADEAPRADAPTVKPDARASRTRRARTPSAPVAAEPAREVAEDDEDHARRDKHEEKRREREDEAEKEMRKQMEKALKHTKGSKAPRLVDVLTPP